MKRKQILVASWLSISIACLFLFFTMLKHFFTRIDSKKRDSASFDQVNDTTYKLRQQLKNKSFDFVPLTHQELLNLKEEKIEAMRLAKWKTHFPWKPTHDPDVKFAPLFLHDNSLQVFSSNVKMATGINHMIIREFFEDDIRFTAQFEQFYQIMKEHDRGENPALAAGVFWALRRYYYAAVEHEPEERIVGTGGPYRYGLSFHDKWGDFALDAFENLQGYLERWEWLKPHFTTEAGQAEANGLINRLLSEVKNLESLPPEVMSYSSYGGMISMDDPDVQPLILNQEELLVPYIGWNKRAEVYWAEQLQQFRISFEQGDPSLKAAAPELFPPVGVKNGRLVDKDGDPVRWYEGMHVLLINERLERVPIIVEDDGTVSLPTPHEVDLMRQNGEIRPASSDELTPPELRAHFGFGPLLHTPVEQRNSNPPSEN